MSNNQTRTNIVDLCHLIDHVYKLEEDTLYIQGYKDAVYSMAAALGVDEQVHFHIKRIERAKR